MTFYDATHRALREADEERLRRLAQQGDPQAMAAVSRQSARRGSPYDPRPDLLKVAWMSTGELPYTMGAYHSVRDGVPGLACMLGTFKGAPVAALQWTDATNKRGSSRATLKFPGAPSYADSPWVFEVPYPEVLVGWVDIPKRSTFPFKDDERVPLLEAVETLTTYFRHHEATHRPLHEADEERLRRLAAMGDPDAQAELRRTRHRQGAIDWEEIARRWSTIPPKAQRPSGMHAFFCRINHGTRVIRGENHEYLEIAVENTRYGPFMFYWARYFIRGAFSDVWMPTMFTGYPAYDASLVTPDLTAWEALEDDERPYTDREIYQALHTLMPLDKWRNQSTP